MRLKVKHKRRLLIDKLLFVICRELLSFAKCVTRSLLHLGDEFVVQLGIGNLPWQNLRALGWPSSIPPSTKPQFVPGCYWECLTARAWDLLSLYQLKTSLEYSAFCFFFNLSRDLAFLVLFLNFHCGEFLVSFLS